MATFTADVFQNEFLPDGSTDVHAVVSVTCTDAGRAGQTGFGDAAEVIIVDTSGSMDMPSAKIAAARRAAHVALDEIIDGTWFAVVAGNTGAQIVYPRTGGMVKMDSGHRSAAQQWVALIAPGGATTIGAWLDVARNLFLSVPAAQRHAILLTDGKQEHETPAELDRAIAESRGVFQCDCRGVGENWVVDQLRKISTALLGTVDIIPRPEDMEADFEAMMQRSMSRGIADVRLRIWTPAGSQVQFVRQVAPTVEDITSTGVPLSDLIREYETGAWSDESRDYHIAVKVPPAPVGSERLAARVEVVVDDQVLAKGLVRAVWSADTDLTTRINPAVAHYTGQADLADAIQGGLAARKAGDERTATVLLGKAAKIAHDAGNESTTRLLSKVVDITDPDTGTVRLKSQVAALDEMALDTRSTKTVRVRREPSAPPAAAPAAGPAAGAVAPAAPPDTSSAPGPGAGPEATT